MDNLDNVWVLFGTGRFQEMNDRATTDQNYLFGIKDPYFNRQYNSSETDYNGVGDYYHNNGSALTLTFDNMFYSNPYEVYDSTGTVAPLSGGLTYINSWGSLLDAVRNLDQDNHGDYFNGWYRELDARSDLTLPSERVISKPAILSGIVFTPIYIPDDDICGFGGYTDIYGLYFETGTPWWKHVFNRDTAVAEDPVQYRSGLLTGPPPPTVTLFMGRRSGAKIFAQTGTGPVLEAEVGTLVPSSDVKYWNEPEPEP